MQIYRLNTCVILGLFFLLFTNPIQAAEPYPPLTAEVLTAYNQMLDQEAKIAATTAIKAAENMKSSSNLSAEALAQLKQIVTTAQAKQILADNFRGTPSLKSPLVRDALQAVMKKEIISEPDLENLKKIVDDERPRTTP